MDNQKVIQARGDMRGKKVEGGRAGLGVHQERLAPMACAGIEGRTSKVHGAGLMGSRGRREGKKSEKKEGRDGGERGREGSGKGRKGDDKRRGGEEHEAADRRGAQRLRRRECRNPDGKVLLWRQRE
jgi:hypothetical protein